MRRRLSGSWLLFFTMSLMLLLACNPTEKVKEHTNKQTYTCPMHPQIVKDSKGSCPICGMDLVAKRGVSSTTDSLQSVVTHLNKLPENGVEVVHAVSAFRSVETTSSGEITYNPANVTVISSRISGRIEKLYVRYNFQPVQKGQKIMEIYSAELVNAQQELLFLKSNGEPALMLAAKKRLLLLGMSERDILAVLQRGKPNYRVPVYSPVSGFVAENLLKQSQVKSSLVGSTNIVEADAGVSMTGMTETSTENIPDQPTNSPITVREGQYVSSGQELFTVLSNQTVWVKFQLDPADAKALRKGSMVRIFKVDHSASIQVPVQLIEPIFSESAQFVQARAVITNARNIWKIGELVNVSFRRHPKWGNWLPKTAILSLGNHDVAFVKQAHHFNPVFVKINAFADDYVDVGSSVTKNSEVARNASFLIDPESFIKPERLP